MVKRKWDKGQDNPAKKGGTFGFDAVTKMFDPRKVRAKLKREVRKAHDEVGLLFKRHATLTITQAMPFKSNSPITIALKGSETPLVNHGDLVGDLTWAPAGAWAVKLGVSGGPIINGRFLREILHNGATLSTSPKMYAGLFAKLREKLGGNAQLRDFMRSLPKNPKNTKIIIPARPFITNTLRDPAFRREAMDRYQAAVDRTLAALEKVANR